MKKLILVILITVSIKAEIRYVKAGSPTPAPPYISWVTAADSIGKALAVCSSGDTVFVGNGTYKESVVIPYGVSLIGQGRDSCIWDLRGLQSPVTSTIGFIYIHNNCIVKGFRLISEDNAGYFTIEVDKEAQNSLIISNEIIKGSILSAIGNVINNVFKGCTTALRVNYDWVPPNTKNTPWLIKDNVFVDCKNGIGVFIWIPAGSPLEISNNYFYMSPNNLFMMNYCYSFFIGVAYPVIFSNNVMIAYPQKSSTLPQVQPNNGDTIRNNVFSTKNDPDEIYAFENIELSSARAKIINNHFENNPGAIAANPNAITNGARIKYNNYWNVKSRYLIENPDSTTELNADPMFVKDTSDFHLQKYSPLIDRGDPALIDKDGTRSDIGAYGGLLGEIYTYIDKAPRVPSGLQVSLVDSFVVVRWKKNTESDFDSYYLYADSVSSFTADTTKFITWTTDTVLAIPARLFRWNNVYFRLKAIDRQNNKSQQSASAGVVLTGVEQGERKIAEKYILYQNYPNPWGSRGREKTRISYELKERGYVKLRIYNILGDEVARLVNEEQPAGYYEYDYGVPLINEELKVSPLASGTYILRMEVINPETGTPAYSESKKMLYVK